MAKPKVTVKNEHLAERCEICHKDDCYDAIKDLCSRCASIQELRGLNLPAHHEIYPLNRTFFANISAASMAVGAVVLLYTGITSLIANHLLLIPFEAAIVFSIALLVFGLISLLSVKSFKIDRQRRQFVKWHGIFYPIYEKQYYFAQVDKVEISSADGYYAKAYIRGERDPFIIDQSSDYLSVRRQAKQFARYTDSDLHDISHGVHIVRYLDSLNRNLISRFQSDSRVQQLPEELSNGSITYEIDEANNSTSFLLPKQGYNFGFWFYNISASLLSLLGIVIWMADKRNLFLTLWLVATNLAISCYCLYKANLHEKVKLTPQKLSILRSSIFTSEAKEIPINELDELEFCSTHDHNSQGLNLNNRSIVAISDKTVMEFGNSLHPTQAQWLLDMLKYRINYYHSNDLR